MEFLDVVDETGAPTGRTVERETAHRQGIRHRTSHVWLVRKRGSQIEILLQKRSQNKDSHPGCYDISSAGHIPAGDNYRTSAIRELWEELGVTAAEDDLVFCGQRSIRYDGEFYGKPFHDNQISNVYLLWCDQNEFVLQQSELESVRWMELNACLDAVQNNTFDHCIVMEELLMVQAKL